ncbi:MAG: hypothetical protein A2234_04215 [Elusimicrobia bacterium RIFOXYA2_FULL_58_8]|nr:MAG: hypothetical protein A2285_06020 [Elusimicrobia bacterium RIFOXYA12_FULL_57_11]OGS16997.1 MAG: hypothetical protein A2234_04215 [Elusimicrobia bacterium RIFOXYA2_FULL_58_8]
MVKKTGLSAAVFLFFVVLAEPRPACAAGDIMVSTAGVSKPAAPLTLKTDKMVDLVGAVDLKQAQSKPKTLRVYKGASRHEKTYKLNLPKAAHWRVLWKIEATELKEKATMKIMIRSALDEKYLQGITKEIVYSERSAFGVMNICATTGGDFTLALDISVSKWEIEVQQLQ